MMNDMSTRRERAIHDLLGSARESLGSNPDRAALAAFLPSLQALACQDEFWSLEEFPCQDLVVRQTRYLLSEDADRRFALYLVVWLPGRQIEPHNHTTWACIAGVKGLERNTLYERRDDAATPGHAVIEPVTTLDVQRGTGLVLRPSDIHRVEIVGDEPTMNLHLYGRALETLDRRVSFDVARQTYASRGIGIPSVRWNDRAATGADRGEN